MILKYNFVSRPQLSSKICYDNDDMSKESREKMCKTVDKALCSVIDGNV